MACSGTKVLTSTQGRCCNANGANCDAVTNLLVIGPSNYHVKYVITATISLPGHFLIEVNSTIGYEVSPGDVIGLVSINGQAKIKKRDVESGEASVKFISGIVSDIAGVSDYEFSLVTEPGKTLVLRAIVTQKVDLTFFHTYNTPGEYLLTLNISSACIVGSYGIATTTVFAAAGINYTIIDSPEFGGTGETVIFNILPLSGLLTYNLHFRCLGHGYLIFSSSR